MDDRSMVRELLRREPVAPFEVVVRDDEGWPVVIQNAPFLPDGRPMPTRYWLVGRELHRAVSRLESDGGVRLAEAEIPPDEVAAAHERHARERDEAVARSTPHTAVALPHGGVGGTRTGVKCLHAHYAWYLAGGADPVGAWVQARLDALTSVPA